MIVTGQCGTRCETDILVYISIAHNIPVHTKLSTAIYLYIHCQFVYWLLLIYLFFLIIFYYLCFLFCQLSFCCAAVASVMKTNSSYVVNIPGNKAHSDSDSEILIYIVGICRHLCFCRCTPTLMATLNSGEKIIFERTHVMSDR